MKLLAGLILGAVVAEDYYYTDDYGERKKKKKKNVKSDACGCSEMPRNAPDAVATCVEDGKRKTIDWTCPNTGTVERMTNVKCRRIKKMDLAEQCGDLTCKCQSEMDSFVALMSPDEGQAVAMCTNARNKPTYKLFCDKDEDNVHDNDEESQVFKVKCRNGEIRKNKFSQVLCGNSIIGGDGWEGGPASMVEGLTCANPGNPFTIIGGQVVNRESTWPWIVKLPGCGGSIISKNPSGENDWILTGSFLTKESWTTSSSVELVIFKKY